METPPAVLVAQELAISRERIRHFVADEFIRIYNATGATPSAIHMRVLEITAMGDRLPQHTVGQVDLELSFHR